MWPPPDAILWPSSHCGMSSPGIGDVNNLKYLTNCSISWSAFLTNNWNTVAEISLSFFDLEVNGVERWMWWEHFTHLLAWTHTHILWNVLEKNQFCVYVETLWRNQFLDGRNSTQIGRWEIFLILTSSNAGITFVWEKVVLPSPSSLNCWMLAFISFLGVCHQLLSLCSKASAPPTSCLSHPVMTRSNLSGVTFIPPSWLSELDIAQNLGWVCAW